MNGLPNASFCLNFSDMRPPPNPRLHSYCASRCTSLYGGLVHALVSCISLWAGGGAAAEPVGTLLYSPAQRQAIAVARMHPGGESASLTPLTPLKPSTTRLDGVVARDSARGTTWVNGEPKAQGVAKAPRIVGLDAIVEGRRLRVGESVDTTTGTKTDIVAPGAVRKGSTR